MTHIGIVCDDTAIQPLLPQVIIGNERTLLARDMPGLLASCPPNVVLLRRKSAWNDEVVCAWLIRRLGLVLAPYSARYQPVLLMDAAKLHTTRKVLWACDAAGIRVVLVPAKLTFLLQPLDTDGFQMYKRRLRAEYLAARLRSAGRDLTMAEFLPCVYAAVRFVLQGTRWAAAFDADGFGRSQAAISAYVREQIQMTVQLQIPSSRPSAAELALCFPRRTTVPTDLLWRRFDVHPTLALTSSAPSASSAPLLALPPPLVPVTSSGSTDAPAAASRPVLGRTRSATRSARLAAAAAVADASTGPAPVATSSSSAAAAPAGTSLEYGRTRSGAGFRVYSGTSGGAASAASGSGGV